MFLRSAIFKFKKRELLKQFLLLRAFYSAFPKQAKNLAEEIENRGL